MGLGISTLGNGFELLPEVTEGDFSVDLDSNGASGLAGALRSLARLPTGVRTLNAETRFLITAVSSEVEGVIGWSGLAALFTAALGVLPLPSWLSTIVEPGWEGRVTGADLSRFGD